MSVVDVVVFNPLRVVGGWVLFSLFILTVEALFLLPCVLMLLQRERRKKEEEEDEGHRWLAGLWYLTLGRQVHLVFFSIPSSIATLAYLMNLPSRDN